MEAGNPPLDPNGKSMEVHHIDGTSEGGLKPMTAKDHRYGENYLKNHPWLKKND